MTEALKPFVGQSENWDDFMFDLQRRCVNADLYALIEAGVDEFRNGLPEGHFNDDDIQINFYAAGWLDEDDNDVSPGRAIEMVHQEQSCVFFMLGFDKQMTHIKKFTVLTPEQAKTLRLPVSPSKAN